MSLRVEKNVQRGRGISIYINDNKTIAYEGETLLATLLVSGQKKLRTGMFGEARGAFCNMMICLDCTVELEMDGHTQLVLACTEMVKDGMKIRIP